MKSPRSTRLVNLIASSQAKSVLIMLFVLFVAAYLGSKLMLDRQARQLLAQADREAGIVASFVERDIAEAMRRGEPKKLQSILESDANKGSVSRIWLEDPTGQVIASSKPDDIGKNAEGLSEIKDGGIKDILAGAGNESYILSRTVDIKKKPECMGCHIYNKPHLLGRLTVGVYYGKTLKELTALKGWFRVGAALLGLVLAISLTMYMTLKVIGPVRRTTVAIEEDLDEKVKRLTALSEISRSMNAIHKHDDLLRMIMGSVVKELSAERGSIMLLEEGVCELVIHTGNGLSPDARRRNRFKMGEGVAGWVAENKRSVIVADTLGEPRFLQGAGPRRSCSMLSVPLTGSSGCVAGVINVERGPGSQQFSRSDLEYLEAIAGQASVSIENVQLLADIEKSYYDTISALAQAVDAKDPYTLGHSKRVTQIALAIGDDMGLGKEDMLVLRYGGTLHDLGKIGISDSLLNKPERLSEEEFVQMKEHAEIGENIVRGVDFLQGVRPIIRNHQESYDGTGYPDGLKGDEIPLTVAIVSVADNFDALTTDRPYRKAKSAEEAARMIAAESGTKYNPEVVKVFLRMFGQEAPSSWKRTA